MLQPNVKMIYCWNLVPGKRAVHHVSGRLNELLVRGWICQVTQFNREQATVWLERKTEEQPEKIV